AEPAPHPVARGVPGAAHFATVGRPVGHGYSRSNLNDGTTFYPFDMTAGGLVRGIVLDTVNQHGGWQGCLDRAQFQWLERTLRAGSTRSLGPDGAVVAGVGPDQLFVLFSHHPLVSLVNDRAPAGGERPVLAAELRELLLRYPNVVAWVNGHTHRHTVTPHGRPPDSPIPGGFWEVTTASHIDWPQQSRIIELVDNADGTLSLVATVFDTAAPAGPGPRTDPLALASLSRELAANAWQRREANDADPDPGGGPGAGGRADRNVDLRLPLPFALG
ncbi:MAG: TIGR03767 family metallophosphoesterase, partial [Frankia sp.]